MWRWWFRIEWHQLQAEDHSSRETDLWSLTMLQMLLEGRNSPPCYIVLHTKFSQTHIFDVSSLRICWWWRYEIEEYQQPGKISFNKRRMFSRGYLISSDICWFVAITSKEWSSWRKQFLQFRETLNLEIELVSYKLHCEL